MEASKAEAIWLISKFLMEQEDLETALQDLAQNGVPQDAVLLGFCAYQATRTLSSKDMAGSLACMVALRRNRDPKALLAEYTAVVRAAFEAAANEDDDDDEDEAPKPKTRKTRTPKTPKGYEAFANIPALAALTRGTV